MPCFDPRTGYRARKVNPSTGKRSIVFNRHEGFTDLEVKIPCGQCIGCRLERSRQWAIRCVHEASLYLHNCFITLTYSDEHLPQFGSLDKTHFQLFMKRLRKRFGSGVRYYQCGEYGERTHRPHYHACLFNFNFPDRVIHPFVRPTGEFPVYYSQSLAELWPFGHHSIGEVTFESAAYVARYILKKQTGKGSEIYYEVLDEDNETVIGCLEREYTTMSRRPGIGKDWYKKWAKDVYPSDFLIINGKKVKPPKFYDLNFEIDNPEEMAKIKVSRKVDGELHADNNTLERLRVREKCKIAQVKTLVRKY